jgi:4-hydroxybutyryl-CoA synthetase (ADP-forming)
MSSFSNLQSSPFFTPKSIAVIGASEKPGVGETIFSNIRDGYTGKVYPITPSHTTIFGIKAYKSVLDVPDDIDLALVITPNRIVPTVMDEIGKKKIGGAVIISAGFKEVGEQGARLEKEVQSIAKRYGTRIIGPNCLGVMSLSENNRMNATFLKVTPQHGNIALVSQSGAICAATVEDAITQDIGFSKVVSMGNKADMDENDILQILSDDPETKVIAMYLEDIHNGRRFMEIAKEVTRKSRKPIIVLKAGRSAAGAKAAMSHTGALMGSDETYDALFLQSGVIRVDTLQDLFDISTAFSKQPIPPLSIKGDRTGVVIVSNAGGPAIISTDMCEKYGLKLADISSSRDAIVKVIPEYGSARNPVDIVGDADADRFKKVISEVLSNSNVSSTVIMCTPSATLNYSDLAKRLVKISKGTDKPMIASLMGLAEGTENKRILSDGGIPHFTYAELAIRTLDAMYRFRDWVDMAEDIPEKFDVDTKKVKIILDDTKKAARAHILEDEGYEILSAYGFRVPKGIIATSEDECINAGKNIGYPVVMKIVSPDIIHKSDAGGVKVGLITDDEVRAAFKTITDNARRYKPDATIKGVLLQEMIRSGKEIILGAKQDPVFGPLVMFGLGGIYVQVFKDVIFRMAPIGRQEGMSMVESIKSIKLLKGVRGEKPSDLKAIVDNLQRLSQLITDFPEIEEFDINPLMVLEEGKGALSVDVRVGLKENGHAPS